MFLCKLFFGNSPGPTLSGNHSGQKSPGGEGGTSGPQTKKPCKGNFQKVPNFQGA